MKDCLKDQESARSELLTNALKIVATHGWEKTEDPNFSYSALEALSSIYSTSLQDAGITCAHIQWDDMCITLVVQALWFNLKLIATKGFSTYLYLEKYSLSHIKSLKKFNKGKALKENYFSIMRRCEILIDCNYITRAR